MQKVRSKDGTQIAYDQTGQGPAVILVDGAFCHRGFGPMPALAAQLAPHFSAFTYDRRGRGDSSDAVDYAVGREIEDLDAMIQAAGGSAFVFGLSSGGALALEAAASGANIRKLAVYEPPYMVGDNVPQPDKELSNRLRSLASDGRRGDAVELFMMNMGTPLEAIKPMRSQPVWPMFEAVAPTLAYDIAIMSENQWSPPNRFAAIQAPALIMAGGASPAWAHNAAEALRKFIPNAQVRTLEGQDHGATEDVLAPVLIEFFNS